ncbi:hypothetical protein EST38_g5914 [Candolleomyces aberdarensis]|uniref:Uncharacterized protein n=1 Tax=Candolleomyces aberdarensis TaxID=2316362 RepID=A0A4Q2DM20_9AGAR|nr:hypothetical protein EST38_g5914 [Candolleomyces aberdarensis]
MLSPFTHHLNTNYVPSDEELAAIRDVVRKGEEVLNDIDQETCEIERRVEELRQELGALAERRDAQKREVDEHKALLSPIKRIDIDILTSIFLTVLENQVQSSYRRISAHHPAVIISHVCQRWRTVALSTKILWRHLHIQIPSYPYSSEYQDPWKGKVAKLVEMTQIWISRSDDCHLSVEIIEQNHFRPGLESGTFVPECTEFRELVDVLLSSSSRWKDLQLSLFFPRAQFPDFPTTRLLVVPPQPTPTLTNVKLYYYVDERQQESKLSQHLIAGPNIFSAPTLRSLEIGPRVLAHDIKHMPVVWSNLEHLAFDGYPAESLHRFDALEALALLKECTNLVTCYVVLERDVTVPANRAPIPLPRLRELVLLPHESHLPKGFAQSLILPSLCKLEVITGYGECTPREHHESGLFEFCERFGPTLEDVSFCYKALTQAALHRCLQRLPNVTSLGLISVDRITIIGNDRAAAGLNRDTIIHLTPQFNAAGTAITKLPLCPRIKVFRFSADRGELAEDALADFIVARRRELHDHPLEGGREVARLREVDCGHYHFQTTDPGEALPNREVDMEAFSFTNWYPRRSR